MGIGSEGLSYGKQGAVRDFSNEGTNLFIASNQMSLEERNAAGPFAHPGAEVNIAICSAETVRCQKKASSKFEGLLRRQGRHRKEVLLSGCHKYTA